MKGERGMPNCENRPESKEVVQGGLGQGRWLLVSAAEKKRAAARSIIPLTRQISPKAVEERNQRVSADLRQTSGRPAGVSNQRVSADLPATR